MKTWLIASVSGIAVLLFLTWVTALLVPKPNPPAKQPCTTDAHCEQMFASR